MIFDHVKKIGWGSYFVDLLVISVLIGVVEGLISRIPVID